MLSAAICDDEGLFCEKLAGELEGVLKKLGEPCRIRTYAGAEPLWQSGLDFDLLLLDIRMPGMDGLTLAKRLHAAGSGCALIFVSAFPEYVFDVFALEAVDYLCKPVDSHQLEQAVSRALGRMRGRPGKRLVLQTREGCRVVRLSSIYFCEVIDRTIYLHTAGGLLHFCGKLQELESRLDSRFYRCHRSYLVNLEHLAELSKGWATLENGERIPVSRLRQREFAEAALQYLKGGSGR